MQTETMRYSKQDRATRLKLKHACANVAIWIVAHDEAQTDVRAAAHDHAQARTKADRTIAIANGADAAMRGTTAFVAVGICTQAMTEACLELGGEALYPPWDGDGLW